MSKEDHLEAGDYAWAEHSGSGLPRLLRRALEHLREVCEQCGAVWDRVRGELPALDERLDEIGREDPAADDPLSRDLPEHLYPAFSAAGERFEEDTRALQYQNRRARRQLGELLTSTPVRRRALIRNAHKRFRSRALAEVLIEESHRRVRNEPDEAADLAAVALLVLDRIPRAEGAAWRDALVALAKAHEANAVRVAGDLPAAGRAFTELRDALDARPLDDPAIEAKITSLEASLRIGQRDLQQADELLGRAAELQRRFGTTEECASTLVKKGNLLRVLGRPEAALGHLEEATALCAPDEHSYLYLCTVTGRVNALCDLERPSEARRLLDRHVALFEVLEDLHLGATLRLLEGRVLLGLGQSDAAETVISVAREAFATLGRSYDADLTALHLAEVYLTQGRQRELRRLAAELVLSFRARGVGREALAALQLFARGAATGRESSRAALGDLRRTVALATLARPVALARP